MRDFFIASVRRFFASGWFWAVVLLALPNCASFGSADPPLPTGGDAPPPPGGDVPHSSAIMCDIEKYQGPAHRCATPQDLEIGVRLAAAAELLVSGKSSKVGLDYSPAAQNGCGTDHPRAVDFQGQFPDGSLVCLNCGAIPAQYADTTAFCVAQCQALAAQGPAPTPPDIPGFCAANAHPSTNFPATGCFDNACSNNGTMRGDFADPRRFPEPVMWTDLIGTAAAGSNLTRNAPATTGDFDAGAVSMQWIRKGDGYVEFEASQINKSHVAGLAEVNGACPFPCADGDPGIENINFAISLNVDGRFYVLEGGALVPGPDVSQSFGTYAAGERFRVHVTDIFGGHATVTYSRIAATCVPGNSCLEDVFYTHVGSSAVYPLRVDTSFREQNATLANVSIVRIQ